MRTFCKAVLELSGVLLLVSAQKLRTSFCKKGFFRDNTGNCIPLLGCDVIGNELKFVKKLQGGFVKDITHVKWNDMDLVYSVPKAFKDDFKSGMELLEVLQESEFVVELVGLCFAPMQMLTKFYKHGSADGLSQLLTGINFSNFQRFKIRLRIAEDYLRIMTFLHSNGTEPRVMCDSNGLDKTLSQYIITDDFHIVLGDLDALPIVRKSQKKLIKCGHRQLFGIFVAPEQLWPFTNETFDDKKMPGYDEKSDIWKIPDVLYHLLGDSVVCHNFKSRLFNIISKCKSMLPQDRPTAEEILSYFMAEKSKLCFQQDIHHFDEL